MRISLTKLTSLSRKHFHLTQKEQPHPHDSDPLHTHTQHIQHNPGVLPLVIQIKTTLLKPFFKSKPFFKNLIPFWPFFTMPSQSDSPNYKTMNSNTLSQMFQNIFSDNSNFMLAAIISLLLVILFVLLLHLYAKWFLAQAHAQAQARRRRRRRTTVTVSDVLGPARFHHFHSFNIEDSPLSTSHTKGLDSAIIAAIPLFIYAAAEGNGDDEVEQELECVICLSAFEDGEMGRCLPKCGHGFHMECIDTWLRSHSNCPICRAPIVGGVVENDSSAAVGDDDDGDASGFVEIVIDNNTPSSEVRESEHGNDNGRRVSDSVSETSSSLFGCSFKTMLSKVFPSSNVNESHA